MPPQVIRLSPDDAARYARLRMSMLREAPWSFAASPEDDVALKLDQLAEYLRVQHSAIVAVESGDSHSDPSELVAAAGIVRMKAIKFAHRARLWGVFVQPEHRGHDLGRLVVAGAIELARIWPGVDYVDLGVSENAPAARALYETLGFKPWGREPEATACGGRRYDEIHMTLRLT